MALDEIDSGQLARALFGGPFVVYSTADRDLGKCDFALWGGPPVVYKELSSGICYGEETPAATETARSWQTWDNGSPDVSGDADWGKLGVDPVDGDVGPVEQLPTGWKEITATQNKYGTGVGTATLWVRGSLESFLWNDVSPTWEQYTAPMRRKWVYIQWKLTA